MKFFKPLIIFGILGSIFSDPLFAQQPPAPSIRSQTYTLVDEQCRADRLRECIAGTSYVVGWQFGAGEPACLPGFQRGATVTKPGGGSLPLPYYEANCSVPATGIAPLRSLIDAPSPAKERIERCASLSQSTVALVAPQCLRTVDTQRLVDTLESDIRLLLRELCQANQSKDCDLKFPSTASPPK